jgi:subtilisin family serine protease
MGYPSVAAADPSVGALMTAGLMRLDAKGRVQVYVRVADAASAAVDELESMGAVVERVSDSGTLIQASVPVNRVHEMAYLEWVQAVTLPSYGRVNVGSRQTEGDAILGLDALRAVHGVSGAGVTVGVISDGIAGLSDAIAAGDLPTTALNRDGGGTLVSTSGGVIGTSFRADGDLEAIGGPSTGAEGTAILEIVHDIAPGAQLRFANFGTSLEFIAAVDFLAANSDVVIDDIGFLQKPYDQTSDVSSNTAEELNRAANRIRGYYTSVGNQALSHYQEIFVSAGVCLEDGSTCHEFVATSDTTDALGLGPSPVNFVRVASGATVVVLLTWDDVFGSATTDYDLTLYDNVTNALVAVGGDDNIGVTREPAESLAWTNFTGGVRWYEIEVTNFLGTQPAHTLELFVFGGQALSNGTKLNFNTTRSSVPAQSDAGGGVISVGAINASEPGVDEIADYSSRGPTNNGAVKPDVVAIDGVSVTGSGGFASTFFGTSAAAPHVAGLAALLLERQPVLLSGDTGDDPAGDRALLRRAIISTAVDLGIAGLDNTYGHGRVQAQVAATKVPALSTWGLIVMATLLGVVVLVRTGRAESRRRGSPSSA